MPSISKIRFTNVVYEGGSKRYNDDIFVFEGNNGAILLENGGGKTVFIQTVLQAILPHSDLAERKIKDTLSLEGNPAHIAVEWILNERPRRYALTAVTLFLVNGKLDSYRYVYEYGSSDSNSIENIPFVRNTSNGNKRPAGREEMNDYYQYMSKEHVNAKRFSTIREYQKYIEENFKIIPMEWRRISLINGEEGGVEKFFDGCKTTESLVDRLLIPVAEEALAGNGMKDFADTFENQREHFKQHNYLKKNIDESKLIQDRIRKYVEVYKEYYYSLEKFGKEKGEGKALYEFFLDEYKKTDKELKDVEKAQNDWNSTNEKLVQKEYSYYLACIKQELEKDENEYNNCLRDYEVQKDEFSAKERRLENLEIAQLKKKIKDDEDEILIYKKQLDMLEKDEKTDEAEKQLRINSSAVSGYFDREFNKLNGKRDEANRKREECNDNLRILREKKDLLDKEYEELVEKKGNLKGELNFSCRQMKDIESEILSNSENETIEEQYPKWTDKINFLEKDLVERRERLKEMYEEKNRINAELSSYREKQEQLSDNRGVLGEKIERIENEEKELLIKIKELISGYEHINSLYIKKEQIIAALEDKCERIRREREELLINERISHRFSDDYKDNEYFTAEPMLDSWINQWRNNFVFLESGAQYIGRAASVLNKDETEYYQNYPYWASSVIVADNGENKLHEKLKRNIDKISCPIGILTQSKAQLLLEGGKIENDIFLYPSVWKDNIKREDFQAKKTEGQKKAESATRARKEKETELERYTKVLNKIKEFLDQYPYEDFTMLKEDYKHTDEEINTIKCNIEEGEKRVLQIDNDIKNAGNKINNLQEEQNVLNKNIVEAGKYLNFKNSVKGIKKDLFRLDFKIEENNKKKEENKKETERYRRIYEELLLELNKIKGYIDSLGKDELYMEVRDFVPEYSPISIEVLKRERKELKDVLNKKQKDRENISYNIMKISDAKEEHRKDLKNLILRAKYQSEKDMEFPIYGEAEIEDLIKSIKVLSPLLDKKEKELNRFKEKYQNIKSKYEVKEEDYFKVYDKIVEFTDSLGNVKKEIDDEKIELGKRIDYLNSMEEKWDKELKSIEEVLNNLRLKNEKYEYLSDNVISLGLSDDMIQGLPYDRMKYVSLVLNSLENIKKETEENIIKVDKEKRDFEMFCSEHISEPRLKNMALWGIKYKDKYDDIIEWQKNIDKRIDKTVNILEMDMMEHDKEINQFVKYLNSYLKSLAQEIGSISKKTRIKVDDKSKNIYIIDVPEWKEEFGKEEIRNYINIMIKDIESNEFKDEEGKEDKSSVRKYIEDKFQAKQLMKALMAGDGIKVKCRKVTNDGKVNSIPVSWEKTNSWSGGEKWSKNMTLFLGILNYLAEKKQSINFEQKRNRTVILDNPFGEASSNHVLDPVFFIAEQLGFQIIALTAHSEGKYIRDYFPIVYSCRLRPSLDKNTQIFTKEREIKYAFFKDNDPQVLSRLGEKEQLTMF